MLDPKELEQQGSLALSNMMVEYEQKIQRAAENQASVTEEIQRLSRQVLELQIRKKDLQIIEDKAKQNVRRLESEHRILKTVFWNQRNAGQ